MFTAVCLISLTLAAIPALMFLDNLRAYRLTPRPGQGAGTPSVSVLIPARDEEVSIGAAVSAVLASEGIDLELIVLDDHSQDGTAGIVREFAARDPRVRLHEAPVLPEGWCGKQHACSVLAALATKPALVFLDADVRVAPDALARMTEFLGSSGVALASGFPRQEMGGLVERMVIPLIHFVLLGFLPLHRMRISPAPRLAAGCGQLFITTKAAYEAMGGHAAIRATLHDGLKLPRAYRASGLKTDLFDATDLATCRMYRSASEVWFGLAKNATEALASPTMIGPATAILFGGQVLPFFLPAFARSAHDVAAVCLAIAFAYLPRLIGVGQFRQSLIGAILHPVGVAVLLAIQWYAFGREAFGRPSTWKGRPYPARTG